MEFLEKFKGDEDDHVFALYLGEQLDKKDFREGNYVNEQQQQFLGKC